jgi:Animal haem peroxidase
MHLPAHESSTLRRSRRLFLGSLGATAGALALAPHAAAHAADESQPGPAAREPERPDRFGRIFHHLPAFAEPTPQVRSALLDLGRPGGLLDANDNLAAGPIALITDPALSANNPDNPGHTAGATFVGQFLDHDLTFDVGSRLGVPTSPASATNGRTPALDLDSVYGGGPIASPQLYDPADRAKLRVESGGLFEDLPRTADHTAIIGDPRNDESVIIAGLHAAFLLAHNRAVDLLRSRREPDDVLVSARRLVTWHYQWLIVHEFLPLFVGQPLVDDILQRGRRFFRPERGLIPVEFQGAAYRFGHSMVRPSYRANLAGDGGKPFFGFIFDPDQEGGPDPADLSGGARAARRFVGWQTFFDFGDGQVKHNKRIDIKISTPLFNLPLKAIASHDAPTVLPQRSLLRHLTWSLPSGQAIAHSMQLPVLSAHDLDELAGYGLGFERQTPLWYYVLKEAQLLADGLRLGPVGGRIVGEVILGLLQLDQGSYLAARPDWRPTLPSRFGRGEFRIVDLLAFAGVDPASRGQ